MSVSSSSVIPTYDTTLTSSTQNVREAKHEEDIEEDEEESNDDEPFKEYQILHFIQTTHSDNSYDVKLSKIPIGLTNVYPIFKESVPDYKIPEVVKSIASKTLEINKEQPLSKTLTNMSPLLLSSFVEGPFPTAAWAALSLSNIMQIFKSVAKDKLTPFVKEDISDSLNSLEYKDMVPTTFEKAEAHYKKLKKSLKHLSPTGTYLDEAIQKLRFYKEQGFVLEEPWIAYEILEDSDYDYDHGSEAEEESVSEAEKV